MAIIPAMQSETSRAIDAACGALLSGNRAPSETLRCSSIGDPCDRRLWFALRWAFEDEKHEPRVLRIFDNGHSREARLVDFLNAAGLTVRDQQARVSLAGGALTGSCDGIVDGVPEAPKTPHLLEIKTMKESRYRAWRSKGVQKSDLKYYAQMQAYMHGLSLTRALFLVENQDTREIEVERVHYDPVAAAQIEAKAARIAAANVPPPRLSDDPTWFECRFCPAHQLCHGAAMPRRNCRTCYVAMNDGQAWECGETGQPLSADEQANGCALHTFIPELVPGELIEIGDVSLTYRMRDGSTFVDGPQSRKIGALK